MATQRCWRFSPWLTILARSHTLLMLITGPSSSSAAVIGTSKMSKAGARGKVYAKDHANNGFQGATRSARDTVEFSTNPGQPA